MLGYGLFLGCLSFCIQARCRTKSTQCCIWGVAVVKCRQYCLYSPLWNKGLTDILKPVEVYTLGYNRGDVCTTIKNKFYGSSQV